MSKSVEKQKSGSEEDEADLEDVLYRNNRKQELDSTRWSKAIVKDVEIFKSYVFRDVENDGTGSKFEAIESFTSSEDPKDAFLRVKDDEEDFSITEWRTKAQFNTDGSFEFNGREYEYQVKHKPVLTVGKSENSGYEKKVTLSRFNSTPFSIYNQISDMKGRSVLIGRSRLGGTMVRTDGLHREGSRATFTEKSKIFWTGAISSFATASAAASLLMSLIGPSAGFLAIISFILGVGLLLSMLHAHRRTSGLYSARRREWLHKLPKSAVIQSLEAHGQIKNRFDLKQAHVKGYENGDVVLETDEDKWTFEGEIDGTPDSEVEDLFDQYGIDMMEGDIEIAVSETNDVVRKSTDQFYVSDSDDNIFITKQEYYDSM